MSIGNFFLNYEGDIQKFLGLPVVLSCSKENKLLIEFNGLDPSFSSIDSLSFEIMANKISEAATHFYDIYKPLNGSPIPRQLFIEELAYSFMNYAPQDFPRLSQFVDHLKDISTKTYETNPTQMGFIVLKESSSSLNFIDYLQQLGIQYTPLASPSDLEIFLCDKQTLKVVDSQSLCLVVDSNFSVIGLARKKKQEPSVHNIMVNRYRVFDELYTKLITYKKFITSPTISSMNEISTKVSSISKSLEELDLLIRSELKLENTKNIAEYIKSLSLEEIQRVKPKLKMMYEMAQEFEINNKKRRTISSRVEESLEIAGSLIELMKEELQFATYIDYVFLRNRQIFWMADNEKMLTFSNGKWKLRSFFILKNILAHYAIKFQGNTHEVIKNRKIDFCTPRVVELYNRIQSLSNSNIGSLICVLEPSNSQKPTIYKEMIQGGKLSSSRYRKIIQTQAGKQINILSCDPYLFSLIASLDGALILDRYFNIESFGEMINSLPDVQTRNYRGARTHAAISASQFGLAIKISEDGDITVFYKLKELARI